MWLGGQSGGITKTDTCVELVIGTMGSEVFTRSLFKRKIDRQNIMIKFCAQMQNVAVYKSFFETRVETNDVMC